MAANDYYNHPPSQSSFRPSDAPLPPLPQDSFSSHAHPSYDPAPSPYMSSSYEDTSYRPYEHSQHSAPSPYYASGGGGRDSEQNPFADDIPLRHNPSKTDSDIVRHDHLPDDPAIIDRPKGDRSRRKEKRGWFSGRIPFVVYTLTLIQCVVFIAELAKNGVLTKSPIEIKPQFNPMIGPSPYVLINMGARFVPCMRGSTTNNATSIPWPCPNSTSTDLTTDSSDLCALNDLCGFGDQPYSSTHSPDQWYRFIIPIFLHAGFIHIAFNMLLQILLGTQIEQEIGPIRFLIVYLSSGIFGFVLGGNLAPEGIASTGASGALFGIIALSLLDLLYHWHERQSPWVDLAWILVDCVISFVLGLLPGLDNFSHIGGFLMGLVLGICILHSPDQLRQRTGEDLPPYSSVRQRSRSNAGGVRGFAKEPVGFFKGRKPLWWVWWLVRAAALLGVLISFIVLVKNFYKVKPTDCHWCRYLSCLPIKNWCDIGRNISGTSPSKRDLFSVPAPVFLGDAF